MEWVLVAILAIFGYVQTDRLNDSQNDADRWQEVAQSNYNEWQEVVEINRGNEDVVTNLENALNECDRRYSETVERVNDFKAVERVKDAAINQLKVRLDRIDFGTCRVPDSVDFSRF